MDENNPHKVLAQLSRIRRVHSSLSSLWVWEENRKRFSASATDEGAWLVSYLPLTYPQNQLAMFALAKSSLPHTRWEENCKQFSALAMDEGAVSKNSAPNL